MSRSQTIVAKGIISEKDKAKLVNLAKDASAKLAALDKFSGREIAKALNSNRARG